MCGFNHVRKSARLPAIVGYRYGRPQHVPTVQHFGWAQCGHLLENIRFSTADLLQRIFIDSVLSAKEARKLDLFIQYGPASFPQATNLV
jgi:hypothetical protein